MSKSRKKFERIQKKKQANKDKSEKRRLKKQIKRLIETNKISEAGFLIQRYKNKFGDLSER